MRRRIRAGTPARASLLRGVDEMANLIRPTLGPLPRTVAVARIAGSRPPEILDTAAVIARRTLQLADPFEDMGGMLIRHLAWRVFEQVGDGAATAAVLGQALVHAGARAVAAGANPVLVRRGMQRGLVSAVQALRDQARPIDGPAEIARAVAGSLRRADLAEMVGEVVDAVGPDGAVLVEDAQGTTTVHEYLDGVRWNEGYVSSFLLSSAESTTTRVLNPRVLATDYVLDRAEHLVPALEACVATGSRSLFVVAPEVRDAAVGLLVANRERGVLDGAIAVRAPSFGTQRARILEDIAVMTGGRYVCAERGQRLATVVGEDLGSARQAWATRLSFGILGGHGDKAAIRQRIVLAKAELQKVDNDSHTSDTIRERIGKLAGAAAVIRVGGSTSAEQEELRLRIEAAVKSARAGLRDGVVPGGGAALVGCQAVVEQVETGGDEAFGVRAVAQALAEPMRVIARNAGIDDGPVIARARTCPGWAYDVLRREWVDAASAGLVDPLAVALAALETSVSTAMTALTAEVLVHRADAPMSMQP